MTLLQNTSHLTQTTIQDEKELLIKELVATFLEKNDDNQQLLLEVMASYSSPSPMTSTSQ